MRPPREGQEERKARKTDCSRCMVLPKANVPEHLAVIVEAVKGAEQSNRSSSARASAYPAVPVVFLREWSLPTGEREGSVPSTLSNTSEDMGRRERAYLPEPREQMHVAPQRREPEKGRNDRRGRPPRRAVGFGSLPHIMREPAHTGRDEDF